jgi:hypothetical protein
VCTCVCVRVCVRANHVCFPTLAGEGGPAAASGQPGALA